MLANHKKIIILETDPNRKSRLKAILAREGYTVFCFDSMTNCFDNMDQIDAKLIVIGPMIGASVIECIDALAAMKCRLPLLLISDDRSVCQYIASNRFSTIDLIDNTFDLKKFRKTVQAVLDQGKASKPANMSSFLVGRSPEMQRIKQHVKTLGRLKESVLISGEPGTGKEALARTLHHASGRAMANFIKIDASELNQNRDFSLLTEFRNKGLKMIDGEDGLSDGEKTRWTIYLDEIGALPDNLQSELLLITGSANGHYRIIAGTHHHLPSLVESGAFREDLYYRLNVLNLKMPPLRHRREDIFLLTDFFSYKFCREFDKTCQLISRPLKDLFVAYDWPGNVDELREIVKRAVLNGEAHVVNSNLQDKVPEKNSFVREKWTRELQSIDEMTNKRDYLGWIGQMPLKKICRNFLSDIERRVMRAALEATNWNRKKAAAMLDISYKSMLNKIKAYEL